MAQRHYPEGWQSRDKERRSRHPEEERVERDSPEMRRAHGRYSASEQGEDRRRWDDESGARYRPGSGSYGGGMERQGTSDHGERHHWEGRFRGAGPKGYSRSDERIREDVCDRLTEDAHLDASDVEVVVKDGEVTLDGTVGRRQDKRAAEDLAERASGVKHVQNNLRVKESAAADRHDAS
jgi:hypothetical protein